jgi:DNA invertase Pin-like site-specific DNA recombinase
MAPKPQQPTTEPDPIPLAVSYLRFSHPDQMKGDSIRRQTALTEAWCDRNKVRLDASLSLRDLGVSAFRGKHRENPDKHGLACFLRAVEQSKVPRGSYLIIENLDRLSREEERTALRLWMDILDAGINIVQLEPETVFRHDKCDMIDIFRAIIELSRGHSESARKSHLIGQKWGEKKRRVRAGEAQQVSQRMGKDRYILTRRIPAWVQEVNGQLVARPERANIIRHIFDLALSGMGSQQIARKLTVDQVPPFGRCGRWNKQYVLTLLTDRRLTGEYQPRHSDGTPDGEPVPGYYPKLIDELELQAVQQEAQKRKCLPGRVRKFVALFAGLVKNARDGQPYHSALNVRKGRQPCRYLVNSSAQGHAQLLSFPLRTFERALCALLAELDPHEVLNGDRPPDDSLALAAELARIDATLQALADEELDDIPAMAKKARELRDRRKQVAAQLTEAKLRAANPLSETFGEIQPLLRQALLTELDAPELPPEPPQDTPEDEEAQAIRLAAIRGQEVRLRLRSALRRIVDSIWMLVVPRGDARLAAVQILFTGGQRHRDYLILHRPARGNGRVYKPPQWSARSLAEVTAADGLDLRKKQDAAGLERLLATIDLETLAQAMRQLPGLNGGEATA